MMIDDRSKDAEIDEIELKMRMKGRNLELKTKKDIKLSIEKGRLKKKTKMQKAELKVIESCTQNRRKS